VSLGVGDRARELLSQRLQQRHPGRCRAQSFHALHRIAKRMAPESTYSPLIVDAEHRRLTRG
jgi:hypothetical protein